MVNNTSIKRNNYDIRKMQRYYFACLREVGMTFNLNPDDLHNLFKIALKKKSTSDIPFEEMYEYLELSLALIRIIFDMYFDSEGYKKDGVSRIRLYGSEKPDNRKNVRKL